MHATLVVMAAGMGSRYGGDKQVDGVGPHGEILMNYGIYDAARAGFDKVVFVIKPEIRDLIRRLAGDALETLRTPDGRKVEFCYAEQTFDSVPAFYQIPEDRTKPFGTTHAVLCTRAFVHEPFCVINADDYYGVDAYRTIYQALQTLPAEGEAAMVGYLYLFIASLMKETIAGRPHTLSSSSQYVLNAIKYIQFNYSHDISIDDVAKSVGVSRSHLYRVFMLNVGKSPIDYLTEYRINEACKLLRAGSLSIAEVAVSVGFFDQFYFSRVFKRAKGVPPSKYFAAQQDADPASPAHL